GNVSLYNLVLEDELLFNGVVEGPTSSTFDVDDDILSPNEAWFYEAYYGITTQDLANGDVINQAKITGWTQDNIQVTDDSDDNSYDENDATLITVDGACEISPPGIGLIKLGYLSDLDGDECPEAIDYTFKVSNRGGEPLANVTISDTFLGTETTFTLESGDDNGNNTLDLGEEWIYTTSYTLTKTDIEAGKVENQAEVTALSSITQQTVMDISDNNSYEENDPTSTEVIDACDPEGPDSNPINENFEIYTGITPNGDGINDFFRINGIEHYPDNVLKIFNRWGVLVYEAEGYVLGNKLFSGVSEGRATISQRETLPSGTYFYTLEFENLNPGQETYSGYLYINRD
ncbi:MAG: gliding motility-associated C-terminal domain-containing protein, partial [Allomuricauda sp.]